MANSPQTRIRKCHEICCLEEVIFPNPIWLPCAELFHTSAPLTWTSAFSFSWNTFSILSTFTAGIQYITVYSTLWFTCCSQCFSIHILHTSCWNTRNQTACTGPRIESMLAEPGYQNFPLQYTTKEQTSLAVTNTEQSCAKVERKKGN